MLTCADHTPCPNGYLAWHEWAETMAATHIQVRCPGCYLFAIWIPKTDLIDDGYEVGQDNSGPWIRCDRCGRTSWNPNDIVHRYCGGCQAYHAKPTIIRHNQDDA